MALAKDFDIDGEQLLERCLIYEAALGDIYGRHEIERAKSALQRTGAWGDEDDEGGEW